MAKLTPAAFAAWVLKHIDQDVWLTEATLARRLAGVGNCPFTAPGLFGALVRAGWLTQHPKYPQEYIMASVCWLSEKPKAPARTRCEGSQIIAHS
ncbi:hypothetical protein FNT36_03110 [Hymenobacter setariae]|uniref:Uncharacterized protein n=1 Tax=Hymenobacter setariae TaxID=2594794 RepID=A0A558C2R8_9BACT|nr:hypothetical protein [Hymenobacter setariae]TVT43095.1 hypothetical protein FNT36_03110 [Hymenobacter setariae]